MTPVLWPISCCAHLTGIYIMVLLAGERYVAICQKRIISLKKTKVFILCIMSLCVLFNIPLCWELEWRTEYFESGNFTICTASELVDNNSSLYYRIYRVCANLIFRAMIPIFCFLLFNFLMIKEIRKVKSDVSKIMGKMSGNDKMRKQEIHITYMTMCIVTVFLVTQFPHYLQDILLSSGIIKPKFGNVVPVFSLTVCIFATLNSTVNTVIYCIFNKKFRDVLFQWFPLKCLPPPDQTDNELDDTRSKATQKTS